MNRRSPRSARSLTRLLPLLLALGCGVQTAGAADSAQDRQKALESLRSKIAAVSQSIEADQAERDALAAKVQEVERRASRIKTELKRLSAQEREQQTRVRDGEARMSRAQAALADLERGLRRQLRAAYIIGRQGQTQLLLNQSDVQKVGRVLVYYDYLQRAQTAAMQDIHSQVSELEALDERLQAEIARLAGLKAEQQAALDQLAGSRKERAEALKDIKKRLSDRQGELKRLQRDEKSVQDLIRNLQKPLEALPPDQAFSDKPFSSQRGKLPWPARGKLLARYGEAKAGGKLSWKGHWISAKEGDPIRAVARGRAVYVGWMHRYGLIVLVEHEGSYYSLYGHAESATVAVGDAIQAGDVIGRAGSTGGHEAPGVYFELRKGTDAIDPARWLAK